MAGSPGARSQSTALLPPGSRGALLREIHVLQLPHFLLVFLLEFLCCFILQARPRDSAGQSPAGDEWRESPLSRHLSSTREAALNAQGASEKPTRANGLTAASGLCARHVHGRDTRGGKATHT